MHAFHLQVPYDVLDDEIPDAWTCSDNVWDKVHNSCNIPQALSDEQIDEILMQQVGDCACTAGCSICCGYRTFETKPEHWLCRYRGRWTMTQLMLRLQRCM
jgi:CW-type Zinc Finger